MKSIQSYIQQQRRLGYSDEQIKNSLIQSGYSSQTISELLFHPKGISQNLLFELQNYVNHLLQQGYSKKQIVSYLQLQGYADSTIRSVLNPPQHKRTFFSKKIVMVSVIVVAIMVLFLITLFSNTFHQVLDQNEALQSPDTIDVQSNDQNGSFELSNSSLDNFTSNLSSPLSSQTSLTTTSTFIASSQEPTMAWALQAQTKDEAIARCEQLGLTKDVTKKTVCITHFAAHFNDQTLCETISSLKDKESCLMNAFVLQGDTSVCKDITIDSNKQLCLV